MRTRGFTRFLLLLVILAMGLSLVAGCGSDPVELAKEGDIDGLIAALQSSNVTTRQDAAQALADTPDPRAVEPLIDALEDENELVRAFAALALGEIGDERAVGPLTQALEDESESVRDAASDALRQIEAGSRN